MKHHLLLVFFICLIPLALAAPILESSINLNFGDSPSTTPKTVEQNNVNYGGGAGFSCNTDLWIDSDYCVNNFCPKYINVNNCSKFPASDHLCCVKFFQPVEILDEESDEEEQETEETDKEIKAEEKKDEETNEDKKSNIGKYILFFFISLLIIGLIVFKFLNSRRKIKLLEETDPNQINILRDYIKQCMAKKAKKKDVITKLVDNGWDKTLVKSITDLVYKYDKIKKEKSITMDVS